MFSMIDVLTSPNFPLNMTRTNAVSGRLETKTTMDKFSMKSPGATPLLVAQLDNLSTAVLFIGCIDQSVTFKHIGGVQLYSLSTLTSLSIFLEMRKYCQLLST